MLEAIENHLETTFNVKTALDFASISKNRVVQSPTVFVIPLGVQTSPNQRDTGPALVRQDDRIGIVIAVRAINDPLGSYGNAALKVYRKQVYTLLFGWVPESGYEPLMVGNGRLLNFSDQTLYWIDEFTTSHLEQAPQ